MSERASTPSIGFSLLDLDSAAIAAIANLLVAWIQTTPPAQHARNHARLERIITFIEEEIFKLPPLEMVALPLVMYTAEKLADRYEDLQVAVGSTVLGKWRPALIDGRAVDPNVASDLLAAIKEVMEGSS